MIVSATRVSNTPTTTYRGGVTTPYRSGHILVTCRALRSLYLSRGKHLCKFFWRSRFERIYVLYCTQAADSVGAGMLYPPPRVDRWDPWIPLVLLAVVIIAVTAIHLLS